MVLYEFGSTSPVRSETSSFTDLGRSGEGVIVDKASISICSLLTEGHIASPNLSAKLLVLDSLFQVVKESIPGLTRESNSGYYYVRGKLGACDKESLYNYAARVGELTLGREQSSLSSLAPNVFVRLAQLQDADKPLFPSLHRLRILSISSSLDFLHVLLSSSLTTLELTAIPVNDPRYSSVLSFLVCAIDEAPSLSTLTLGPGLIDDQIIDICLKYKNLRCLELLDVGIAITDKLLRDIGSLQHLEALVLRDNGTSTYERTSAIPAFSDRAYSPGPDLEIEQAAHCGFSTPPPGEFSPVSYLDEGMKGLRTPVYFGQSRGPSPNISPLVKELPMEPQTPLFFGWDRGPSQTPVLFGRGRERSSSLEQTVYQAMSEPSMTPQSPVFFPESTVFDPVDSMAINLQPPITIPETEPEPQPPGLSFNELAIEPETPALFELDSIASPSSTVNVFHAMGEPGMEPQPPVFFEQDRIPSPHPTVPVPLDEQIGVNLDSSLFRALRTLEVGGTSSSSLVEDLLAKISSSNLRELSLDFTKLLERTSVATAGRKKRKHFRGSTLLQPPLPSHILPVTLLRRAIQKWGHTLVSFNVKNDDHTTTFSMPSDIFEILLLRPDMKKLKITGIGIDSMDNTLRHLKDSKLEVLHLPVHPTAPCISFARLRHIAEACPRLDSFRCRFRDFSNVEALDPLSHQLKELLVSNEEAHLGQRSLLEIARYLDSIFPNLRTVGTHDGNGNNVEEWGFISDLVRLCQAVRKDDEHRRLCAHVL